MPGNWNWKSRDGNQGGLLYESGNWGDLLKMLWLKAVLDWKSSVADSVPYFDPFAAKKFRVQKSTGKVLASIFWDQDGIFLIDNLPKGQNINAE